MNTKLVSAYLVSLSSPVWICILVYIHVPLYISQLKERKNIYLGQVLAGNSSEIINAQKCN